MRKYITTIYLVFIVACNADINDNTIIPDKDNTLLAEKKTVLSALNNDTLLVLERAAVFVLPDSSRIAKRKKEIGEENFQIGADDYAFYMNGASEFLDSVKMHTLDTKDKKVIKFTGEGKAVKIIEINKLPELWNIFFFDPSKTAKQIDMISIEEEYKNYFTDKQ